MFVRFKQKQTKAGQVFNLSLQRSYRDSARMGQVRSETICGLGSIPERPHPTEASLFWFRVDEKLRRLALSADDEAKVRTSIAAKIPRPPLSLPQLVRLR